MITAAVPRYIQCPGEIIHYGILGKYNLQCIHVRPSTTAYGVSQLCRSLKLFTFLSKENLVSKDYLSPDI